MGLIPTRSSTTMPMSIPPCVKVGRNQKLPWPFRLLVRDPPWERCPIALRRARYEVGRLGGMFPRLRFRLSRLPHTIFSPPLTKATIHEAIPASRRAIRTRPAPSSVSTGLRLWWTTWPGPGPLFQDSPRSCEHKKVSNCNQMVKQPLRGADWASKDPDCNPKDLLSNDWRHQHNCYYSWFHCDFT